MVANDPSYSRDEIDLKMENLFRRFEAESNSREERLEADARRRDEDVRRRDEHLTDEFRKIDNAFRNMDKRFDMVEKDISWLGRWTVGLTFLILSILVAGAVKLIFH